MPSRCQVTRLIEVITNLPVTPSARSQRKDRLDKLLLVIT